MGQASLFSNLNFNPCEIREETGICVMLFRKNAQRQAANMVRGSLLVFTVSHDFTLNAEIRYALL